ncbi:hypothetical protein PQQ86_07435 [Paraburkholderia sediminicola]
MYDKVFNDAAAIVTEALLQARIIAMSSAGVPYATLSFRLA